MPAQSPTGRQTLLQAEQHFQNADLLKAEPIYRAALPDAQGKDRRLCYDRLLAIYFRLARHDQAIHLGEDYRTWLANVADEPRRREVLHQLGVCHLILGHYATARQQFTQVLEEQPKLPPLPALLRIEALSYLAQLAEKRNQREEARKFWLEAEARALEALAQQREALTWTESVRCVWSLSECYRFLDRPAKAIEKLESLLEEHDRKQDPDGKCETLRMLAGHRAAKGDVRAAEKELRLALALAAKLDEPDRVRIGDLWQDLAGVLRQANQKEEASKCREEAARQYQAVARAERTPRPDHQPPEVAFWKLQRLHQQAAQYQRALELAEEQQNRWTGESLAGSRLQAEQGILNIYRGSYKNAHPLLNRAVEKLERQSPPNLIELPRAMNSLAIVEQTLNNLDRAEQLAKKTLKLYKDNDLPDDLVRIESWGIVGASAALRGDYVKAIDDFRTGIASCEKIGPAADQQHSNLLLNIALLYKSQGDLDGALRTCQQALTVYRRFDGEESPGFACFLCALAGLDAARGRFSEAGTQGRRLLELCERFGIKEGPLVLRGWHCVALDHLHRKEIKPARQRWLAARELQRKAEDPLLARTLNYLALLDELEGQFDRAEVLYREAQAFQEKDRRAYPVTYFTTLWRLAGLLDRRKETQKARALLEQAIALVEAGRLRTYGDAVQRAAYFAQFADAFEWLVNLSVGKADRVGEADPEAAFLWSARSRSRNLFDQLQASGVDPRTTLGAEHKNLLDREAALRQTISTIRLQAQMLAPTDANSAEAKTLLAQLEKAQNEYAEVWRDILNASPVYRNLAGEQADLLATLRRDVLRPGTVLVTYHIGPERSYLMLLSGAEKPEVFELTVPPHLVDAVTRTRYAVAKGALGVPWGLALQRQSAGLARVVVHPSEKADSAVWPLNRKWTVLLVDHHLRPFSGPGGLRRDIEVVPVEGSTPDRDDLDAQIADVLLPKKVRKRLQALAPAQLVVVPDSAVHKIPLESLVLKRGESPRETRYALDELPPTVYAPSISTLALLARRKPIPSRERYSLLTVCNPAYPQREQQVFLPQPPGDRSRGAVLPFQGQLPLLPHTKAESRDIAPHFDPKRVDRLDGQAATERGLRTLLAGRQVVHLAVHGVVDEHSDNLFGALALTPPKDEKAAPEDDGFLSLLEIYMLSLPDCDLAVLSACQTNVGPQRPLEAGVTLANGFLSAGARHIVASHWKVEDRSTAELMSAFFARAMKAGSDGKPIPYAVALHEARRELRNQHRWASPLYWAPFVLIGTGEGPDLAWPAPVGKSEEEGERPKGDAEETVKANGPEESNALGKVWILSLVGLVALIAIATLLTIRARYHTSAKAG